MHQIYLNIYLEFLKSVFKTNIKIGGANLFLLIIFKRFNCVILKERKSLIKLDAMTKLPESADYSVYPLRICVCALRFA